MSTNSSEFETETTINIGSQINVLTCNVYKYLEDVPYEIPVEIISLISKFYLTESHTNADINTMIKLSIPKSVKFSNPIPTIKSRSKCCSNRSLLSIRQFTAETFVLAITGCFLYWIYSVHNAEDLILPLLLLICIYPVIYGMYLRRYWKDINRIIAMSLYNANERILSFNNVFNVSPIIEFYIDCYHEEASENSSSSATVVTFRKQNILKLQHCETLIEPNIYNEDEIYAYCFYHIEYNILIHFNTNHDRLKYQQICRKFILNNIHDKNQTFEVTASYRMFGIDEWLNSNDNYRYMVILNSKQPTVWMEIWKFMATLCTILCVSWLYKLPLYLLSKRKKLNIIHYISVGYLEELDNAENYTYYKLLKRRHLLQVKQR